MSHESECILNSILSIINHNDISNKVILDLLEHHLIIHEHDITKSLDELLMEDSYEHQTVQEKSLR